jgi:hypothetical protein
MNKQYTWIFSVVIALSFITLIPFYNSTSSQNIKINELSPIYTTDDASSFESTDTSFIDHSKNDNNFFKVTLMQEIDNTDKLLRRYKNGSVTPDAEFSGGEYYRLNIAPQALGYLNLYKITGKKIYLKEAEDRLVYLLKLGDMALQHSTRDGMIGYAFLYDYELTKNITYLDYGIKLANECSGGGSINGGLNNGLMCAMALGKAYNLTGNISYALLSRNVTKYNGIYQSSNGGFPHGVGYPIDSCYSSWMAHEMFINRIDDPGNPDNDLTLLKMNDFLLKRVNSDGSINYEDKDGVYWEVAQASDDRGWMSELGDYAYNLKVMGEDQKSKAVLKFLFSKELKGINKGGYSPKWGYNSTALETSKLSILRTSLVFWELTSIPLIKGDASTWNNCKNGQVLKCKITPKNCNVGFQEMGACNLNLSGNNYCFNGVFTGCLNKTIVNYTVSDYCSFSKEECNTEIGAGDCSMCNYSGMAKCVNLIHCAMPCVNQILGKCSFSRCLPDYPFCCNPADIHCIMP